MTKGEKRKARKAARVAGQPFTEELSISDRDTGSSTFTESARGYEARHRWAKWYDSLNGAPDGPDDY